MLDGSENFALIKGNIKKNKNPRVRVISSNVVKNYLMGQKLPNSFNKTILHFKNYKDCHYADEWFDTFKESTQIDL